MFPLGDGEKRCRWLWTVIATIMFALDNKTDFLIMTGMNLLVIQMHFCDHMVHSYRRRNIYNHTLWCHPDENRFPFQSGSSRFFLGAVTTGLLIKDKLKM